MSLSIKEDCNFEFIFKPRIDAESQVPIYAIYDSKSRTERVAELYIPEGNGVPKLRIRYNAICCALAQYMEISEIVELSAPCNFEQHAAVEAFRKYLNELTAAAYKFIEDEKKKKARYGYRVIFNIPLSDSLRLESDLTHSDAWRNLLPFTATNVKEELSTARNRLHASLYFDDKYLTDDDVRVLRLYADTIKLMLTGKGVVTLYEKIEQLEAVLKNKALELKPCCHVDVDSWVIFEILEGGKDSVRE